jgi:hypothetical protein
MLGRLRAEDRETAASCGNWSPSWRATTDSSFGLLFIGLDMKDRAFSSCPLPIPGPASRLKIRL